MRFTTRRGRYLIAMILLLVCVTGLVGAAPAPEEAEMITTAQPGTADPAQTPDVTLSPDVTESPAATPSPDIAVTPDPAITATPAPKALAVPVTASATATPSPTPRPTPRPTPTPMPTPTYEDTMIIIQSAEQSRMVAPEEMQVRLTLVNDGPFPIGDIRICRDNGSVIAEAGVLPDGAQTQYQFSDTITPTDTQLNDGAILYLIRYKLGYNLPGQREAQQIVRVPLTKLPAEPGIEFTRTLPLTSAKQGEEVAVAYRVRNTGNVALTDLVVTDALAGEIGRLDRLDPGKRQTFIYRFTIVETATSIPTITYSHRATREQFEQSLAPAAIYLANERLDITLEADQSTVAPGEPVTLAYRVVNRGSTTYDRLRLSDQGLGELVSLPGELKPGKDYVFTKTVAIMNTTTFQFTLTGRSAGGTELIVASNPLTVAVTPVSEHISLELLAEADATVLNGPGDVTFTLTVRNKGELDIRDVRLSERERGAIWTLAVAAPGDTFIKQVYHVEEPSSFIFLAELTDAKGGRLVVLSDPAVNIAFAQDGRRAERVSASPGTPYGDLEAASYQLPSKPATFMSMMVGALVVLGILTTLIAAATISHRRRKRKLRDKHLRRLRRNYRREQMEDTLQHTRPIQPVRPEAPRAQATDEARRPGSLRKKPKGGKKGV